MSTRKYPTPFYAAAGAGEYAYQRLRKLVTTTDLDLDRVRGAARTVYADLVARGERVVGREAGTDVDVQPAKRTRPAARK